MIRIALLEPAGTAQSESIKLSVVNKSEPLGLCYIAASAQARGWEVRIWQQINESDAQVIQEIINYNPQVLGVTAMSYNFEHGYQLSAAVKASIPIKIVFGGIHITTNPTEVRRPDIDFGVIGEGDLSFCDLLEAIESGASCNLIPGLAFYSDEKLVITPSRKRIQNIDVLPFPLRDGLMVCSPAYVRHSLSYPAPSQQFRASVNASRGCVHRCKFCTSGLSWQQKWVGRSPSNLMDEIEHLVEQYGANYIEMRDENFTEDSQRVLAICDEFHRRQLPVTWYAQGRITDMLDKQKKVKRNILRALREAGCFEIEYGVESGSQKTLDRVSKGITLESAKEVIATSRQEGLSVHSLFILGFPWEDYASLQETLRFAQATDSDRVRFAFFTPFVGTALYEKIDKSRIAEPELSKWTTDNPIVPLVDMTINDMREFRRKAYREFYFSDAYRIRCSERISRFPQLRQSYEEWFLFIEKDLYSEE